MSNVFKVGCHLSSSNGYLAMGKTALEIGANTRGAGGENICFRVVRDTFVFACNVCLFAFANKQTCDFAQYERPEEQAVRNLTITPLPLPKSSFLPYGHSRRPVPPARLRQCHKSPFSCQDPPPI